MPARREGEQGSYGRGCRTDATPREFGTEATVIMMGMVDPRLSDGVTLNRVLPHITYMRARKDK